MRIRVIAVGTKMPGWVSEGCNTYAVRMPPEIKIEWVEIAIGPRGKGQSTERAIAKESEQILRQISDQDLVIALEVKGKAWSTETLAQQLHQWQMSGRNICLLIGGPDGLSDQCRARADSQWSLSALTLPHPLVRVVVQEQLYRAWSINANHPYHRS